MFVFMFTFVFNLFGDKVYAADYEVYVAVFCDNVPLAQEYVKQLCKNTFDGEREIFIKDSTGSETQTIIETNYGATKYHVYFYVVNTKWALHPDKQLDSLIKKCTGAIILYNISDPKLSPILKSHTFYKNDVETLIKIETPLNNCIRYLQTWGHNGWHNALEFITYGKENLESTAYNEYHEQINRYTCSLEKEFFNIDNKWSRGHPDCSTGKGLTNPLGWIAGQAYRSIFLEKTLTGASGLMSKKKLDYLNPPTLPETKIIKIQKCQCLCTLF